MLAKIQDLLVRLYDLPAGMPVEDFVCDAATVRQVVGAAVERGEVLLVAEDEGGIHVGLYVDPTAVNSLRAEGDPWLCEQRFSACCLATEGVSHFVYLTFRAHNQESVSQLELELQAEVDKYATGLLAGYGVGAIRERSRQLRFKLFDEAEFIDGAKTEEGARYRLANRLAAKYVRKLESEFVERGALDSLETELRRFYRLGIREKIEAAG